MIENDMSWILNEVILKEILPQNANKNLKLYFILEIHIGRVVLYFRASRELLTLFTSNFEDGKIAFVKLLYAPHAF